jgi:hypothetical protein
MHTAPPDALPSARSGSSLFLGLRPRSADSFHLRSKLVT